MFIIKITDGGVIDAFNRLIAIGENPSGALMGIGEAMLTLTNKRFESSADPYGTPWQYNSDTTLRAALHRKGTNHFRKDGSLRKSGETLLAFKKPLIGEGGPGSLLNSFHRTVIGNNLVTVSSDKKYAAMQNFGGTKAEFPNLWGDIPARSFFPDLSRGLPDEYSTAISDVLRSALLASWKGGG